MLRWGDNKSHCQLMKMQGRCIITGSCFQLGSQWSLLLSWFILLFLLAALHPHQVFMLIPGHWVPPGVDITPLESEIRFRRSDLRGAVTGQDTLHIHPNNSQPLFCPGLREPGWGPGMQAGQGVCDPGASEGAVRGLAGHMLSPVFPENQTFVLFLKIPGEP